MEKEKAERIFKLYNWTRFIIIILFLIFVIMGLTKVLV